jgi:transketolase N-terminal domain/subunit
MKRQLLEYSYQNGLSHIASAMSMLDYVDVLFTEKVVTPDDVIVIGKPFGAQAYYIIWRRLGFLDNIENLSVGVKHDEIAFVDYSEETMGNALGVAIGIAMTTDKRVWVNISDAALQMGNTLEAIQFIGHNNIKNIFLTVDYNDAQVTGSISDVLKIKPTIQFFKEYSWFVQEVDGHDKTKILAAYNNAVDTVPNVYIFHTQKGHGVKSIEQDIKKWHYRKIETQTELQLLVQELQVT